MKDSFKWIILATVNLAVASVSIYFLLLSLAKYRPIVTQHAQEIRSAMRHDAIWQADKGWNVRRGVKWCARCSEK